MENNFEILNDSCMDLVAVDTTSATHPSQPNDRMVPFCCAANLPGNFNLAAAKDPRILYDLSNLSCKIEPKCPRGSSCSRSFDITVVGSIPFIANATVAVGANQCSTASTNPNCPIKISCGCVVPVRNTVCNVCSYEEAIKACALLELKLRSCTCVAVTVDANQGTQANRCVVTFTGNFTLPNCATPINVTCPRA